MSFVASRTEIDYLDYRALQILQQNIFGLQIAVYQPGLIQERESCQELLGEDSHKCRAQTAELVLLNELVQVDAQQLENETQMLSVDESVP